MRKVFAVDVSRCCGCYNCQIVCKDEHVGNDWAPIAKPQPDVGQFWLHLDENVQGSRPKVKIHYIPKLCNHCENPACVAACPEGAAYKREDGLVVFDTEKCSGCKKCMEACPYEGVIYFNEELKIAQKCTGCAHLLDNGYTQPRCVEACPTDALAFGDEDSPEIAKLIRGAEVLQPETGLEPKVYYRNIPGKFIAGTVFSPDEDEVLIGATCRLNNGGKVYETKTDDFGDFWFKDLAVGYYDLVIEADGYKTETYKDIDTIESVNMGDIGLAKAGEPA